ncbi:hypothetical protein Salat_2539600 [Sesamum alatum]|uniref:Uncharacterized protein n=1 Tax=Sesamum alatum TaxID=300844 RepID=A0AAE2CCK3_9LAMI|nr:hypothetical protein Salat_2539600 [Sesamum alatum]
MMNPDETEQGQAAWNPKPHPALSNHYVDPAAENNVPDVDHVRDRPENHRPSVYLNQNQPFHVPLVEHLPDPRSPPPHQSHKYADLIARRQVGRPRRSEKVKSLGHRSR